MVELVVVLAIVGILLALATQNWTSMQIKGGVEGQIRTVFSDVMGVRVEALYTKRPRSVVFSGKTFNIYSSNVTSVSPILSKSFKYDFIPAGSTTFTFNTSGMANGTQGSICVDPYGSVLKSSDAVVDSMVVSQARINLGKRTVGNSCASDNIKQK